MTLVGEGLLPRRREAEALSERRDARVPRDLRDRARSLFWRLRLEPELSALHTLTHYVTHKQHTLNSSM